MPEVSIIIPTYNRDKYLVKTLSSLINQSFKDFEVFVCDDDGQTGKTEKITNYYKKYLSITYLRQENKDNLFNPAAVRNLGAIKARGKYLFFLDCDMIISPYTILFMHDWICSGINYQTSYLTPLRRIHIRKNITRSDIIDRFINIKEFIISNIEHGFERVSLSCCGIILKSHFNKVGGFDEILFNGLPREDAELKRRLLCFINIKEKKIDIPVYHLNHRGIKSKRNNIRENNATLAEKMMRKKLTALGFKYDGNWSKDYKTFDEEHYAKFLNQKELMRNISKKLFSKIKKQLINNC